MSRPSGMLNLSGNIEVKAGAPLDSRAVVPTEADLIVAGNFPYKYVGMATVVQATGEMWILTGNDVTVADNWHKVGSGGSDNVIEGYYYNSNFYEDSQHTTLITGASNTLYVDVVANKLYWWDGTNYQLLSGVDAVVYQPAGSCLFANLPNLGSNVLGFVYNIEDDFTTTSDFIEGQGHNYPAGTNVVIANFGSTAVPNYKYDVLTGTVDLSGYQTKIQFTTMPTASIDWLGKIVQFVGTSSVSYTNGFIYECVSDGESTPTYTWVRKNVQPTGLGIKNNGITMVDEPALNFTGFDMTDDSTNSETDIKAHRLTSAEMAEICSPLPGVMSDMPVLFDERGTEYQVGWYVYSNGTKKPVYEKCFSGTTSGTNAQFRVISNDTVSTLVPNIEKAVCIKNPWGEDATTNLTKEFLLDACINANARFEVRQTFTSDNMTYNYSFTLLYTKSTDIAE